MSNFEQKKKKSQRATGLRLVKDFHIKAQVRGQDWGGRWKKEPKKREGRRKGRMWRG